MKFFASKDRILKGLLVLLLMIGMAGFNSSWAQSNNTIIDDRGQTITIPDSIERIVVAGTALFTEIMIDLDAKSLLVGVTNTPNNPAEAADLPKVGFPFPSPNLELIIELEPDVVFGAVFEVRDQLEAAGLTVITPVSFISSIEDLFSLIQGIAFVVDRDAEADAIINTISRKILFLESRVVQETPRRTAFVFAASAVNPPFVAGKGSLEGELLSRAGGINVFSDIAGGNLVSFESILERDPEVIFTDPSQVDNIIGNPLYEEVTAVREGNVFGIPASSLTSTRIIEALEQMAEFLHPEVFAVQGN